MKLIIGGCHQGKKAYAENAYQIRENEWADGANCSAEELLQAKGIFDFQEWVRIQLIQNGKEKKIQEIADAFCKAYPDLIVVSNEVGYGIVPMQKEERMWREACGRACTVLAQHSEEVIRVCCGIGMKIK